MEIYEIEIYDLEGDEIDIYFSYNEKTDNVLITGKYVKLSETLTISFEQYKNFIFDFSKTCIDVWNEDFVVGECYFLNERITVVKKFNQTNRFIDIDCFPAVSIEMFLDQLDTNLLMDALYEVQSIIESIKMKG